MILIGSAVGIEPTSEVLDTAFVHRVHWLTEQEISPKRAFLVGISLLLFILTQIATSKRKEKKSLQADVFNFINKMFCITIVLTIALIFQLV